MAARPNMLDNLTDLEIIQRYRFDRRGIEYLEDLLRPYLQPRTARHQSLSVREKILIALRYFATGGVHLNDGDIHHVSQSTVSKAVNEVVTALCTPALIQQFVSFPTQVADLDKQAQQFYGTARFPKVVGVIDGTHIKILAPSEEEDIFVNRKGYHSINVQVVFDAFDRIEDIVARWPGSTHDSRILHNSGLRQLFEKGIVHGGYHLLGDSGYPCRRWLLTPYLNPQPGAQSAYNR
ncbi:putative nuclease HARBI1 [Mercenaria mercenaria]|uniref:putative nuclease HARBI1 n=1 Tax=Mercenaria mercenaria TaxID=6596 RepID=UPI00234F63F4|nr:putative nuclease HARBI1 [Mercenaria mercenaria]